MNAHSADAALRACGAAIAALDAIIAGHITRAFCAVRPPGHHASASIAMGFCLFNAMAVAAAHALEAHGRSEEHTSELQSLMRISYAVFCLKKKRHDIKHAMIQPNNYINTITIT